MVAYILVDIDIHDPAVLKGTVRECPHWPQSTVANTSCAVESLRSSKATGNLTVLR